MYVCMRKAKPSSNRPLKEADLSVRYDLTKDKNTHNNDFALDAYSNLAEAVTEALHMRSQPGVTVSS